MPGPAHRAETFRAATCAVVTVSDTRTPRNDTSGDLIARSLSSAGHRVFARRIVKDEPEQIRRTLLEFHDAVLCDAILLSGGTGLGLRDGTYEAVTALLTKRLDGFGELFRFKSYQTIGPAAMLSRAVAGTLGTVAVFSMPGSPAAVQTAMEELILPELGHILNLLRPADAPRSPLR